MRLHFGANLFMFLIKTRTINLSQQSPMGASKRLFSN